MKELYKAPIIETEELVKEDVLCGSFENKDNITVDIDGGGSIMSADDIFVSSENVILE